MPRWGAIHTANTAGSRDDTDRVARAQLARRRAAAEAGHDVDPWGPPPGDRDREDKYQAGYQTQVLTVDPATGILRDGLGRQNVNSASTFFFSDPRDRIMTKYLGAGNEYSASEGESSDEDWWTRDGSVSGPIEPTARQNIGFPDSDGHTLGAPSTDSPDAPSQPMRDSCALWNVTYAMFARLCHLMGATP